MLAGAVMFWQVILAVHIVAVVVTFGVTFAYPLFVVAGRQLDPRAMPWFHRMQQTIGRRLVNPGLLVVLLAGIYLASKLDQWHAFYVQWGIAMVIVLGGIEGSFMIPREGKLAELAERDIAAASDPAVHGAAASDPAVHGAAASDAASGITFSPEYEALARRVGLVGAGLGLLVVVTVYLMSVQAGA